MPRLCTHAGRGVALAVCVVLGLPASLQADERSSKEARLQALVKEVRPFVETRQGRTFQRDVPVRYVSPMEMGPMMMGGGGGMPAPDAMGAMLQGMAAQELVHAALGLSDAAKARRWLDDEGRLRPTMEAAMRGGPPGGGMGGPMGGPSGMPGMGGPGGGMPAGILGAFYDQHGKRVFLLRGAGPCDEALVRQILVHELTHALDDQHENITRLSPTGPVQDDRQLAQMALVEGHAVNLEMDWNVHRDSNGKLGTVLEKKDLPPHAGYLNEDGTPAPRKGPDGKVVRDHPRPAPGLPTLHAKRAVFPYAHGFEMVKALRLRGVPITQAYARPPESTEQILHPERYLGRGHDAPSDIAPSDTLRDLFAKHDVRLFPGHTAGEFGMRGLLEALDIPQAQGVAAGWDGDLLAALSVPHDDEPASLGLLWATTWDTDLDAFQFEAALRTWCVPAGAPARPHAVLRAGRHVLFLLNVPAPLRMALATHNLPALLTLTLR